MAEILGRLAEVTMKLTSSDYTPLKPFKPALRCLI
jgi:hypothetical protein